MALGTGLSVVSPFIVLQKYAMKCICKYWEGVAAIFHALSTSQGPSRPADMRPFLGMQTSLMLLGGGSSLAVIVVTS